MTDRSSQRMTLPAADERRVEQLEARLGVKLPDRAAALSALTHTSFVNEHPDKGYVHNERLEFLGDAVIDLAIGDRLMRRFPSANEGELTRLRASLVNEEGLASIARALGLGEMLLLGRGEELTGGREKDSVLADAFEAVVGVVYLAGGLPEVLVMADRFFGTAIERVAESGGRDFKTQLQEMVQSRFKTTPRYRVVSESGPDHLKTFCVEIEAGGESLGRGDGRNKKEAEQAAAREALKRLLSEPAAR